MKTSDLKDSITGVVVIETELPRLSVFEALGNALAIAATDSDIIIVANDVSAKGAQELRHIAEIVPDVTVSFLARRTDREAATVVGIDQALGDWVVVLTPTIEEDASLSRVLEKAGPFEVVFAGGPEPQVPDGRQRTRWYHRLYGFVTGVSADAPRIRVYSRAAARYLSRQLDAESMLASIAFSGTFPGIRAVVAELPPLQGERLTISTALRKTLRAVRSVSAIPLRVTIAIALATGFFALLNSMYAVLAGPIGNLPFVQGADIHYGEACILTPCDLPFARDGVADEATPNVETMVLNELDIEVLRRSRLTGSVRTWLDRRVDLYAVRYTEGGKRSEV
jgi:hypothetical protein